MSDGFATHSVAMLCAGIVSYFLVRGLIPLLTLRNIVDRPGERTSHVQPTPRGGGIGVCIGVLCGLVVLALGIGGLPSAITSIFAMAGGLAVLSLVDDLRPLHAGVRFLCHALVIGAALALGAAAIPPTFVALLGGVIATGFVFFAWLWFVNLYNFMDGIDGISAIETMSISAGLAVLAMSLGGLEHLMVIGSILFAATAGFLVLNWHPAKIFLGDVGSIPLGFVIGWMLLELAAAGQWAAAIILPLYYLADATITLLRRAARGEKVWHAHKEHFYQRAHQRGLSHAAVSLRILAANIALIGCAVGASLGQPIWALGAAVLIVGALLAHFARVPPASA